MKILVVFLFLGVFMSCRPMDKVELTTEVSLPFGGSLNEVVFFDENLGLAVGGDTWYAGYMAYTLNGGNSWQLDSVGNKEILALDTLNGEFFAGGIDGYLYNGLLTDTGLQWTFTRQRYWEIIHDMHFNHMNSSLVAVGGSRYKYGFCQRIEQEEYIYSREIIEFDNVIECIAKSGQKKFVAAGFGIWLYSEDGGLNWEETYEEGAYFRALDFRNENEGLMCTYNGSIRRTDDGGKSWTKSNGTGNFFNRALLHTLKFDGNGTAWVCGEKAALFYSEDMGNEWTKVKIDAAVDFTSLGFQNEYVWITTSSGKLLKIRRP